MTKTINNGGAAFPLCPGQDSLTTQRFLKYVDIDQNGDLRPCWNWRGAKNEKGYGLFTLSHKKQVKAHRFSYEIYSGRKPSDYVLHLCDNPACVNPTHLKNGTHGDNMKQMVTKRRQSRAERHYKSKLILEEAISIILLYRSGEYTNSDIAEMFNISEATTIDITSGKSWNDAHMVLRQFDAMIAYEAKEAAE